ncbi:hypothetical protein SS50377_22294 [Spironucleus salmonicida]|uniref:EGF-like domain-containing protein n=1 Tax=Spironucleus salmonicida TaxID=348837 RepID=V6LEW0_9EUKA|nr:hypothetical protein SS50377_22294 [Spironucleus salmonicida]|eukprot:EST42211.1 Hypothetical protein SS50377_18513 [Spironucleus salmonicida]
MMILTNLLALSVCDVAKLSSPDPSVVFQINTICIPISVLILKNVQMVVNLSQFTSFQGMIAQSSQQVQLTNVTIQFNGRISQKVPFYGFSNGQIVQSQISNTSFRYNATIIATSINLISLSLSGSLNLNNNTVQGSLMATCTGTLPLLTLFTQMLGSSFMQYASRLDLQTNCGYNLFSPSVFQSQFTNVALFDKIQVLAGGSVVLNIDAQSTITQFVNQQSINTQATSISYQVTQNGGQFTNYVQNLQTEGPVVINLDSSVTPLTAEQIQLQPWIANSFAQVTPSTLFYLNGTMPFPIYVFTTALFSKINRVNFNRDTLCNSCIEAQQCSLTQTSTEPLWTNFELVIITTFNCQCSAGLTGEICNLKATVLSLTAIILIVIIVILLIIIAILVIFLVIFKKTPKQPNNDIESRTNSALLKSGLKQHRSITPASVVGAPSVLDDQRISNLSGAVTPGQYRSSVDPPKSIQIKAPSQQKTIQDVNSPFSITGYSKKQWKSGLDANDPSIEDTQDSQLVDDEAPAVNLKEI